MSSCRICTEPFSSQEQHLPRTIPCGHTFCHSCLGKWTERPENKENGVVKCPTCRAVFKLPAFGFPMNFALLESMENKEPALESKQPALPAQSQPGQAQASCMDCDQPATHFCASCGNLCSQCSAIVHQRRSAHSHKVVPLQDKPGDQDQGQGGKRMCAEHKEEVQLFCMDCKCLACAFCVGENVHEGHVMKDLEKAAKLQSLAIFSKLESYKEFLTKIGKQMEEVRSEHEGLDAQQQALSATITASIQDIMESLRQRETSLQRQLVSKLDERREKLNQLLSQGSEALLRIGALNQDGDRLFDLDTLPLLEACGAWLSQAKEPESLLKKSEEWIKEVKSDKLEPSLDVASIKNVVSNWGMLDYSFAPGTNLDCLDTEGMWLPAEVLQRDGDRVFIHYINWEAQWDEWIDKNSERLAPMGTRVDHSRPPRPPGM